MVNRLAVTGDRVRDVTPLLLRGAARFTADLTVGMAEVVFVRSPLAHARVVAIDVERARRAPGVLGVFTASHMPANSLHEIHIIDARMCAHPLAVDVVRHVGEPVAVIAATSLAAGLDAAELVDVTYEPLPPVISADDALAPGAPLLFPELGTNIALQWNLEAVDALFGADAAPLTAAHIVSGEITAPRACRPHRSKAMQSR